MKNLKTILLLCLPLIFVGCKGGHSKTTDEKTAEPVRLILDYLPNTLHVAFYAALDKGYYTEKGLDVSIMTPTSTSDTLKLMATGKAEFGLAPLIDVVAARASGEPVVILAGIVQTPLAAVITTAGTGVKRPKDLENRLVGTSGIAGDEIIVRSMMINDGADPAKVKFMNIGYNIIQSLAAGQIDAVVGFWSQEAILFEAAGGKPVVLRLESYGFPKFPEIVLFCREDMVKNHPETVRNFLAATDAGMQWSLTNRDEALKGLAAHVEGVKPEELTTFFEALKPVFVGSGQVYGFMDVKGIQMYAEWATKMGLINLTVPASTFVTNEYLPTK